ncbi:hypothetical protein FGLOB1_9921 [Fusarium globosum]|uniref:NACHT domain-containing protein n=1 Tax=Fusarium globosum TaxID=78864 RepID=A0A8H5XXU0_9HYPO|nr:hypothetical protein FGLOB1_9921 [Fusarium globosum]
MSIGIEVIGTVAALYQLINASAGLISEYMAVQNGEPTADNHLEEHVENMKQACALTTARYKTMDSFEKLSDGGRRVRKTAEKCQASAQALLDELRYVRKKPKSNDCMAAVAYAVKSKVHRKKIERMDARFKNDQQELQTILQSEILSKNQALQDFQKEEFENLEEDIRILITQVSQGFSDLGTFIKAQHEATNKIFETRLDATDNLIVHEVAEVQRRIITESQRKQFLASFRYPEINKRYNDVLDSSEANFDRVFASYEKATKYDQKSILSKYDSSHSISEAHYDFPDIDSDELRIIDKSWSSFINWLRSGDSLFCIQGKPGSGKSTLIKFVIDNENTQRLLKLQSPEIVIMSHFFWKIGSKEQSSIKGFLCSLVYQLLARSEHLQELTMGLYDTGSHKSHHDWSSKSLKGLLRQVLKLKAHAICVFVDGLDEVANDDGLDKLTREIEEILQLPGIKICVSSRPEASVVKWLERLHTPSILLEDLTRPEMSIYVHRGLDPLLSSQKLSVDTHQYLCDKLVRKSQGVFLWLSLVLRSIIDGIQNGDPEKILMKRLAELPSKIHDLYADIWGRLNERSPVYRKDAVRFVLYILRNRGRTEYFRPQEDPVKQRFTVVQPVLGQIAFAEMPHRHEALLKYGDTIDFKELQEICYMTKSQIEVRCGGLLQIRMLENGGGILPHDTNDLLMQQVAFIHRTAHDFFTETEAGRSILRSDSVICDLEIATRAMKGLLCLHRTVAHQHGVSAEMIHVIYQIERLGDMGRASAAEKAIGLLPVLQSFFMENIISGSGTYKPKCHFLTYLGPYIAFHEFILSEIKKASSARLATQILQETCCEMGIYFYSKRLVPLGLIESLMLIGADAHACIRDPQEVQGRQRYQESESLRGSSFASFLKLSITEDFIDSYKNGDVATLVSEVVTRMAAACPNLNDTTLMVFSAWDTGRVTLEKNPVSPLDEKKYASILVEAKLSFLVDYLFSQLEPFVKESAAFRGLSGKLELVSPEIRFILTQDEYSGNWMCSRISAQQSCEKLVDFLFPREGPPPQANAQIRNDSKEARKRLDHITALLRYLDVIQCNFETEMLSLAAQKLGVCNFHEAGIVPSFQGVKEVQEARGDFDSNIVHDLVALSTYKDNW